MSVAALSRGSLFFAGEKEPKEYAAIPNGPSRPQAKIANSATSVAVVYVRAPFRHISESFGPIAIDASDRALLNKIELALKDAGAIKPTLSVESDAALTRLIDGTVHAAVVAVIPAYAADAFPNVPGLRKVLLPISP